MNFFEAIQEILFKFITSSTVPHIRHRTKQKLSRSLDSIDCAVMLQPNCTSHESLHLVACPSTGILFFFFEQATALCKNGRQVDHVRQVGPSHIGTVQENAITSKLAHALVGHCMHCVWKINKQESGPSSCNNVNRGANGYMLC